MSVIGVVKRMSGYRPLKADRIHLRCPKCGRKQSNMLRIPSDPLAAVLAEILCPKCGSGGKDADTSYYDSQGRELNPETGAIWPLGAEL
jgi:predicted RNA-binding Zn-ribbon protein involved in translation (DUF1610 family)